MRDLVDVHYPEADPIRVVLDNLSVHKPAALYRAFEPAEARRIQFRLVFHFTPKHASWLNMVEIEIGVMVSQCLDRRVPDKATQVAEIAAWERRRNPERAGMAQVDAQPRSASRRDRGPPASTGARLRLAQLSA